VPTTPQRRHGRWLAGTWTYPVCIAGLDMHAELATESEGAGEEVGCEVARQSNGVASHIDRDARAVGVLEAGCLKTRVSRPAV
jgi:hypothetical protein